MTVFFSGVWVASVFWFEIALHEVWLLVACGLATYVTLYEVWLHRLLCMKFGYG